MKVPEFFTDIYLAPDLVRIEFYQEKTFDYLCGLHVLNFVLKNREQRIGWEVTNYVMDSEYHEWFILQYPWLINRITNLSKELKEHYSQLDLIGKFGLYE